MASSSFLQRRLGPILLAALGLLGVMCEKPQPATQVIVVVNSNLSSADVRDIQVQVMKPDERFGDDPHSQRQFSIGDRDESGQVELPFSFSIVPPVERSSGRFRLIVTGFDQNGRESVEQQFIAGFRKHEASLLEVFLHRACLRELCRQEQARGDDVVCNNQSGMCEAVPELEDLPNIEPGSELEGISPVSDSDGGVAVPDAATATPDGAPEAGTYSITPAVVSGTRLKRRYYDGGDGAELFHSIWDSALETECSFGKASDEQWRCLPPAPSLIRYLDAGCTRAVAEIPSASDTPEYAAAPLDVDYVGTRFPQVPMEIYRVESNEVTANDNYYTLASGDCAAAGDAATIVMREVTRIDPGQFVPAQRRIEPRADGLTATYLEATDGFSILERFSNIEADYDCASVDGRCVPGPTRGIFGRFADANCTEKLTPGFRAIGSLPDQPPTTVVEWVGGNDCDRGSAVFYEPGELIAAEDQFVKVGEACEPASGAPPLFPLYRLGKRIPARDFPPVLEMQIGSGRLRGIQQATSQNEPLGWSHDLWDTKVDSPCQLITFSDDTVRCVPQTAINLAYPDYAEPDCTGTRLFGLGCSDPSYAYESDADGNIVSAYEAGAEFTGGTRYTGDPGTCNITAQDSGDVTRYYFVGDAVQFRVFPEVVLKTD